MTLATSERQIPTYRTTIAEVLAAGDNGEHGVTTLNHVIPDTYIPRQGQSTAQELLAKHITDITFVSIGCGAAEDENTFLEALQETYQEQNHPVNLSVTFVDLKPQLPEKERGYAHELKVIDAVAYLESLPDNSIDILFAQELFHFLPPEKIEAIISLFQQKLKEGGKVYLSFTSPFNNTAISRDGIKLAHNGSLVLNERLSALLRYDEAFSSVQVGATEIVITLLGSCLTKSLPGQITMDADSYTGYYLNPPLQKYNPNLRARPEIFYTTAMTHHSLASFEAMCSKYGLIPELSEVSINDRVYNGTTPISIDKKTYDLEKQMEDPVEYQLVAQMELLEQLFKKILASRGITLVDDEIVMGFPENYTFIVRKPEAEQLDQS